MDKALTECRISRRGLLAGSAAVSSLIAVGELAELVQPAAAASAFSGRDFAFPDRVRYDGHCLTIDGRDTFIYSGSFHYFRCPKPLWRRRFEKIKQAGFNCVQTYITWNVHENAMPKSLDDYSRVDLTDLEDYLSMAEEFGLYVLARPGPYICSEWDTGGFPQWLLTKRPANYSGLWLRSDEPTFMAWSRHWYNAVCPVIARHQITRRPKGQPGVIMFQVENEYDFTSFPLEVKRRYVRSLVAAAIAGGIDVPFYINWGQCVLGAKDHLLRKVFDTCDFYPQNDVPSVAGSISGLGRAQPHAPRMTAELQGGWFTGVGDAPALVPDADLYINGCGPAQINNLTQFVFAHGDTITNYYMLFGGTNMFGRAGRGIATSYDYSAPIRECGGVGGKFLRVKAIAEMLKIHGPALCRAVELPTHASTGHPDVTVILRQAVDGSRYYFIRSQAVGQSRAGTAVVRTIGRQNGLVRFDYALEPFGAKILYFPAGAAGNGGVWLPEQQASIPRPDALPESVNISDVRWSVDPGAAGWQPIKPGQTLVDLGVYDSRAVFYRRTVKLSAADLQGPAPRVKVQITGGGSIVARVNGLVVERKSGVDGAMALDAEKQLKPGNNLLEILYQDDGHANGGGGMEALYGVTDISIARPPLLDRKLDAWRMKMIPNFRHPGNRPEIKPAYNDAAWRRVSADSINADQLTPGQTAVFRTEFIASRQQLNGAHPVLRIGRVDDLGSVFLNGRLLGRTQNYAVHYEFNTRGLLKPGRNVLAVVVHNIGGAGGLGDVHLSGPWTTLGSSASEIEFSPISGGHALNWESPSFCACGWRHETLPQSAPATDPLSLMTWHRLNFTLPAKTAGVWVPWCLDLQARGNGFIYLNGYNIGRHWQLGGQRYFYLPECWLKFGSGQTNAITMCLHSQGGPAGVLSAAVRPYKAYAEHDRA